ncbi:type II toxin-antitoxin system PemK/MazF family toxin [Cysteiniphilum halobium]|uniref:type II toxin-antitoxin system PemK/MazF family toxin n=1 Tax=Cysteiniphilum halobium TaxID=2219059 RepID=UPI003F87C3A4
MVLTHQTFLDSGISSIFICPLSTQSYDKSQVLHVKITARDHLQQDSFALPEQCRSISMIRLEPILITSITDKEGQEIFSKLDLLIGFKENINSF